MAGGGPLSRRYRLRRAARIALPLAGGALVGLSLPPLGSWPVGVLGAAAVVSALRGRAWKGRMATGLLAGIGQFSIGLAWAVQFNAAGYVALVIVETLVLTVGLLLAPPRGVLRVPAVAGAITVAEWARQSWPFGGLPLGSAALGQVGGPLQFTARLGGPLLVVFTLALAGGALGEAAAALLASERGSVFPAVASIIAAAALAAAGAMADPSVPNLHGRAHEIRVALVQGGGKRGLNQLQVPPVVVYDAALAETTHVTGHPNLILWPEDVVSMGTVRFAGSPVEHQLAGIARRFHATLVAGVTEDVGATRFLNEVVALGPSGRVVATFEKVHRVPFGEYVPFRSFFERFVSLKDVPRNAIPGTGSGMIATPAGRLAVLISYEVFFADRGRSGVRAGGRLVIVPTNTSSYSNDQAPAQEISASRLQALEEGRYVLQAAPTGYSAVITPSGVVVRETALSRPAVIEATVPLISGTTPYEAAGDLPVLIASGGLLVLGWMLVLTRREDTPRSAPA